MLRPSLLPRLVLLLLLAAGCASHAGVTPEPASTPAPSTPAPSAPAPSISAPSPPAPPVAAPAEQLAAAAPDLDKLYATLWVGTSVEYRAEVRQTYTAARAALDAALEAALEDPSYSAVFEPTGTSPYLPPAIILDVDETVLDNTPYQEQLIREGKRFDLDSWNRWCEQRRAKALPGAVELTQYAVSHNVKVFFVTNRSATVQQATCDNLRKEGFPLTERCANVMTRGLRREWDSSDKGLRRAEVAKRNRVVQVYGDDLGDFLSGNRVSPAERAKLVAPFESWWGRRWIVLPNPIYGSWADALIGFEYDRSEAEALELRRKALRD